jgi:hypothetical protein
MKIFLSFWNRNFKISSLLTNIIFLWRILYLYIVTLNCKLWIHLFWLYLKIFNIFVKKKKEWKKKLCIVEWKIFSCNRNGELKCNRSDGFRNSDLCIFSQMLIPTELAGLRSLSVNDRYTTKTFTCTHFHIFRHSEQS